MAKDCPPPRDLGFSLAEVVLVIAIFAILAGTSIPILESSMRSMQLNSDARNIATALASAKVNAMSQMNRYQLSFDFADNLWSIQKCTNKAAGTYGVEGATNHLSRRVAFEVASGSAPSGFSTGSSSLIRFNSRGIPIDEAGNPKSENIIYVSNGNSNYAVSVSLAGKVQLWREDSGHWNAN